MHGINEDKSFRATSVNTLCQMVKAGTAVTMLPMHKIDPSIVLIPFEDQSLNRSIGLVWRKRSAQNPLIGRLIHLLSRPEKTQKKPHKNNSIEKIPSLNARRGNKMSNDFHCCRNLRCENFAIKFNT